MAIASDGVVDPARRIQLGATDAFHKSARINLLRDRGRWSSRIGPRFWFWFWSWIWSSLWRRSGSLTANNLVHAIEHVINFPLPIRCGGRFFAREQVKNNQKQEHDNDENGNNW
jgi:hypothetical protein